MKKQRRRSTEIDVITNPLLRTNIDHLKLLEEISVSLMTPLKATQLF